MTSLLSSNVTDWSAINHTIMVHDRIEFAIGIIAALALGAFLFALVEMLRLK